MYSDKHPKQPGILPASWDGVSAIIAPLVVAAFLVGVPGYAQSPSSGSQSSQSQTQSQPSQKQDQVPAEAGGPTGDVGPMAVPKKSPQEEAPPPPKPKAPAEKPAEKEK